MKVHSFYLIIILISGLSFSQTGSINGFVTNKNNFTSLSNVRVELAKTGKYQLTDATGNFVFSNVASGDYTLLFSLEGFELFSQIVAVKANETTKLTVFLQEKVIDIPEVVITQVSLTGGEKGLKDLPGSAYYISPKELQKFSYSDINRVLKSIPGVNLQEEDGFGLRPNIGLRGAGVQRSTKITIMEDGILSAPAPYSASAAYYFPTVARMQAVEILKGSAQIKYGPYTTGGAINLISTQLPAQFTAKFTALGGSFYGKNLHAYVGNNHGQVAYSIEAFHYGSDGFKHLENKASTGFNKSDYVAKLRLSSKKTAKVQQSLTLKAGLNNEVSNDTYLGLSLSDFSENPFLRYAASQKDLMTTKQTQLSAMHVIQAKKWLTITSTIYRNDFSRNWYKLDAVKDSAGTKKGITDVLKDPAMYVAHLSILKGISGSNYDTLFVKGNNRSYFGQGVQTVIGFDLKSAKINHDIDLGIRFHQDGMDRFQNEDKYKMDNGIMMQTVAGELGRESNRIASAQALATYIQYKASYKNLLVTAGFRNEIIQLQEKDYGKNDPNRIGTNLIVSKNDVSVFIPGIAIDYKFSDKWTIFAGVHKGFSPPSAKESSKPEASINYEGGLKLDRLALRLQVVAFYNAYSNLLGSDLAASGGAGTGDLFNGGKSMAKGLELFTSFDAAKLLKKKFAVPLTVAYTYSDARFLSDFVSTFEDWGTVKNGDQLPYLAKHQLNIGFTYEYNKWMVNTGMKFTSNMRAVAGTGKANGIDLIPQATIVDASIHYQVAKNIQFFGSVTNITNKTYLVAARPAGVRPGMPRAFQFGLKAKVF